MIPFFWTHVKVYLHTHLGRARNVSVLDTFYIEGRSSVTRASGTVPFSVVFMTTIQGYEHKIQTYQVSMALSIPCNWTGRDRSTCDRWSRKTCTCHCWRRRTESPGTPCRGRRRAWTEVGRTCSEAVRNHRIPGSSDGSVCSRLRFGRNLGKKVLIGQNTDLSTLVVNT